jgi:putative transcriptional regulator
MKMTVQSIPYSHLSKGTFLIATPDIETGLFFRGVVLLAEHSPHGSLGIIVNKSLEIELPPEVLDVEQFQNPHVALRAGGPVQTNQMMILHTSPNLPEQSVELAPGLYLGADLEFLQKAVADENGPKLILCFGYSGWGSGQLEREFLDGQWYLCPAAPDILFDTPAEQLWRTLLRSMGGKYATLSMIPDDLSLN